MSKNLEKSIVSSKSSILMKKSDTVDLTLEKEKENSMVTD
jgi:hypothetical protein